MTDATIVRYTSWMRAEGSRHIPARPALNGTDISLAMGSPLPATCWRARKSLMKRRRLIAPVTQCHFSADWSQRCWRGKLAAGGSRGGDALDGSPVVTE